MDDRLLEALAGLEWVTDPAQIKRLSLDYYHFSPVLTPLLEHKRADLVVRPRNEAEVLQIARASVATQTPLTVRGAGTGNYGQCVPLQGGIVLDMTHLNRVLGCTANGLLQVEAGARLAAIELVTRPQGWELRIAPSTIRTATVGGFVGGGSVGMGSITYGLLAEPGNLLGVRLVSLEDAPRLLEVRGRDLGGVLHAYGTTGIITQLEMPLAPVLPWSEQIVAFEDFLQATRFAWALATSSGIDKKLISVLAWPIPQFFPALQSALPVGKALVLLMVAEAGLGPLQDWVASFGGEVCFGRSTNEEPRGPALVEYGWNHTTLHARAMDPQWTYLQTFFPFDPDLDLIEEAYRHFGDEVLMHLECVRSQGIPRIAGLQLVRYSTPERLQEIIDWHEQRGALIFNPHTYLIEDGGDRLPNSMQLDFKRRFDPYGLLNPGKMRFWAQGPDGKREARSEPCSQGPTSL
jgi:FAD/FMN-containing dehydrogenase